MLRARRRTRMRLCDERSKRSPRIRTALDCAAVAQCSLFNQVRRSPRERVSKHAPIVTRQRSRLVLLAGRTARPSRRSRRSTATDPASLSHMAEKRYLLTPGPTPVPPEVLAALAEPVIHHRASGFRHVYERCLARLAEVYRTQHDVLMYTTSGTGAFES